MKTRAVSSEAGFATVAEILAWCGFGGFRPDLVEGHFQPGPRRRLPWVLDRKSTGG